MVIYTAITGNYDLLKEQPELPRQGLQLEAFLDREQPSRTWRVRPATTTFPNPRLNAKYHKILSHINFPSFEYSLWIDGSIVICPGTSVSHLADYFLSDSDIAVFAHRKRYCLYQEAAHCMYRHKDDPETIRRQVFRYTQEGYPTNNGLAECGVLLRRHTKRVKEFNDLWWNEILGGSGRDQISFPYAIWKVGVKVNYIPGSVGDGSLFLLRKHFA
jgi:hypothetical protein